MVPKNEKEEVEMPKPVRFLLPTFSNIGIGGTILVNVLRAVTFFYDWTTFLFYYWKQDPKPPFIIKTHKQSKADIVSRTEASKTWHSTRLLSEMHRELEKLKIDTMEKVFSLAIKKNGMKRCFGTREMISEDDEIQSNGKVFKKYEMGNYIWKSYNEVDRLAISFTTGLSTLGLKPKDKFCIFAETRAEWFISSIAAFKNNYTIVTLYATLGDDAVIHGLRETECAAVITSHELLPKFKSILKDTPHVKHIIYMEHPLVKTDTSGFPTNVTINSFCDVIDKGRNLTIQLERPKAEDVAIVMYTSGSTGVPKGVLLSHKNVTAGMKGLTDVLSPVYPEDVYIGYLPLAHVLELMCEAICFLNGIPIGYSSPLTITDKSSKIKTGSKGDAGILQPTIMVSVPFALDRISKAIQEQVSESSSLRKTLFYFFYDYKIKWACAGYTTPIVDAIILKKARAVVGGKVRVLITGGAPLALDTQEFVRTCLCVPITQGYGLTETCASASCSTEGDISIGRVGPPLRCCDIRLVNWDEGDYTVNDKPNPRGEMIIGGDNVAIGYYKLPENTAQDFFVEADGTRWFRTGDIAEANPDGAFKIIDRKKDLVKLQMGEYLSLGKVESTLKTSPYIETICIYADPLSQFCVSLVVPAQKQLEALADRLGKKDKTLEKLCSDPDIEATFLKEIKKYANSSKLQRFETPMAVKLCSELWSPDTGLVTAAFKLRRRNIQKQYQSDINRMYASLAT